VLWFNYLNAPALQSLTNCQGPQIYQSKFGPTYRVSYLSSIGLLCGTMLALLLTWFLVARQDKQTDGGKNRVFENGSTSEVSKEV
jgi:hypothetical protein